MRTQPTILAALLLALVLQPSAPSPVMAQEASPDSGAPGTVSAPPAAPAAPSPAPALAGKAASAQASTELRDRISISLGYDGLSIDGPGYFLLPFSDGQSQPIARFEMLRTFPGDTWLSAAADYLGQEEEESHSFYRLDLHLASPGAYEAGLSAKRDPATRRRVTLPPAAAGSTLDFESTDLDPAAEYEICVTEMDVSGRVKVPNYPAHLRLAYRRYENQGTVQQMALSEGCTGGAGVCHLTSRAREFKTVMKDLETGLDAHLGMVDVSLTFLSSDFEGKSPASSSYSYTTVAGARTGPPEIPTTSYSARTLAVSTNSAGRVAAGLGLGNGERENKSSGLTEKSSHAGLELLYRPFTYLSLALKGRRSEQKQEAGASVAASRVAGGLPVEPDITHETFLAAATYAPVANLRLRGDASRETTIRDDTVGWDLPDETTTDTWKLALEGKPGSELDLRLSFQGRSTNNPSYPSVPTEERKSSFTASWAPFPQAQLLSGVTRTAGRNSLNGGSGERVLFHNSATYTPTPPVTVSLIYDHFADDRTTDLYFEEGLVVDAASPYSSQGDLYLLSVSWQTTPAITLTGEASYALVGGSMSVKISPYDGIEDYSRVDAVQQGVGLGVRADLGGGWGLTSRLALARFEDSTGASEDEEVTQVSALVSRSW